MYPVLRSIQDYARRLLILDCSQNCQDSTQVRGELYLEASDVEKSLSAGLRCIGTTIGQLLMDRPARLFSQLRIDQYSVTSSSAHVLTFSNQTVDVAAAFLELHGVS
jgi:hypothetical protein